MLYGFEEQTCELNDNEREVLLPLIIKGLTVRIGEEKAITNVKIREGMEKNGTPLSDARVRKIVHYIRVNRLIPFLCASSKGYWIETDRDRFAKWVGSLQGRVNSITEIINAAQQDLDEPVVKTGQLDLMDALNNSGPPS